MLVPQRRLAQRAARVEARAVYVTEAWLKSAQHVAVAVVQRAALRARDESAARSAMSEHLAAGAEPLIAHLTRRGVIE